MVDFGECDISVLVESQADMHMVEHELARHAESMEHMPGPSILRTKYSRQEDPSMGLMPVKKDSVLDNVVTDLNKRFLKNHAKGIKKDITIMPERKNTSHRLSALSPNDQKQYDITKLFSAYLGKLKTAHNIYRNHMIAEYEAKKQEEPIKVSAKPTDMSYDEVEKIITAEKVNRLMGTKIHNIGAEAKEKWAVLKLFPFYKILSMLRYQTSMT